MFHLIVSYYVWMDITSSSLIEAWIKFCIATFQYLMLAMLNLYHNNVFLVLFAVSCYDCGAFKVNLKVSWRCIKFNAAITSVTFLTVRVCFRFHRRKTFLKSSQKTYGISIFFLHYIASALEYVGLVHELHFSHLTNNRPTLIYSTKM